MDLNVIEVKVDELGKYLLVRDHDESRHVCVRFRPHGEAWVSVGRTEAEAVGNQLVFGNSVRIGEFAGWQFDADGTPLVKK